MLDSKPEAPDTVMSERESETQGKEEDKEIQEAELEGNLPGADAEGEPPVSGRTQEEIPSKLAVEQMKQIK